MKIIVLTKQSFLVKELNKSQKFKDLVFIKNFEDIFNLMISNKNDIFIHHFDSDENIIESYSLLKENFIDLKLIAFRNNTNNIEGCSVLKKGYKSYVNSISNIKIIENVIESVQNGNVWIYPELMQFLISSVPVNDNNQNKLLENLTIKELEVLKLVGEGLSNSEISKILSFAEVTVKKYISSLFKKLDVKDRLSLALVIKNYS